jgi:hypothetical protein
MYKYDPTAFAKYQSTVEDTHKPKMGWRMRFIIGGAVLLVFAMIFGPGLLKKMTVQTGAKASASARASASPQGSRGAGTAAAPLTDEEWSKRLTPRVEGVAWSAPIYDGQAPRAKPEYYCMSSGPGLDAQGKRRGASHTCVTEQGTAVILTEHMARLLARYGAPYNPFKEPPQAAQPQQVAALAMLGGAGVSPAAMAPPRGAALQSEAPGYGRMAAYGQHALAQPD